MIKVVYNILSEQTDINIVYNILRNELHDIVYNILWFAPSFFLLNRRLNIVNNRAGCHALNIVNNHEQKKSPRLAGLVEEKPPPVSRREVWNWV